MTRWLTPAAIFSVVVIAILLRRIRRDAGGRVDTGYFQRVGWTFVGGVLALTLAHLGGAPVGHPLVVVPSALATYGAAYFLTLFAYSFPLDRPAPARLRLPLLVATALFIASTVRMSLHTGREPAWTLLYMLPYFALSVVHVRRNWRRATVPGESAPSAPVSVVQLAILTPWVLSLLTFGALYLVGNDRLPPWIDLAQCVAMAVVVVGGVGVAILRYHLFSVRVLVAEAVVSTGAAAILAGYLGVVAPSLHGSLAALSTTALATVVVAGLPTFLLQGTFDALERFLGRTGSLVSAGPSPRDALERALSATARTVDPDAVIEAVLAAATEVTGGRARFLRHGPIPEGAREDMPTELADLLDAHRRRFHSLDQAPELPPALLAWMRRGGAHLVVPVRREGALHGALVVDAEVVSRDATLLCASLAEHVALKLENLALYAEQARLAKELEESRRLAALGSFAAAMAHDIRTPLTSIAMNVQILRGRGYLSEGDREYLDIASEEIARLDGSVAEILDFARPLQLRREPVAPRELLDDVARTMSPVLADRGLGLAVECAGPEGAAGPLADPRALRQLLINLIDNAADASVRGGTVSVQAAVDDERLVLRVVDRGRGIAPEHLGRIFEPFFTTRPDGTGLGLAIAQKIVRGHAGEISVRSEPERGTIFEVTLPGSAN